MYPTKSHLSEPNRASLVELLNARLGDAVDRQLRPSRTRWQHSEEQDTADIFTDVSRGVDKWFWFVEAHLQAEG